jgi:phosphoglycerol transferase MdoB-like AlkP superfamily enzyme
MSLRPSRRAILAAMIIGLVLHTITVLLVWKTWGDFGRGNVLAWIDFPSSLAYLHLDGSPMLAWSLVLGGLQWSLIAALLTWFLGLTLREREEEEAG